MPVFEKLPHTPPWPDDGIIIDSDETLANFIKNISEDDNQSTLYVSVSMIAKMRKALLQLPQGYQEAFHKKFPPGLVGFEMSLGDKLTHVEEVLVQSRLDDSQEADNALEESLDILEDALGDVSPEEDLIAEEEMTPVQRSVLFDQRRATSQVQQLEPAREFTEKVQPLISLSQYNQLFSENPYGSLAQMISHQDDAVMNLPGHGRTYHFKRHLDNILPIVAFAVAGARQAWEESSNEMGEKQALQQKMETFEAIDGMLRSLRALASNKSRYTENQFVNKLSEITALLEAQNIEPNEQAMLQQALQKVIVPHLSEQSQSMFYQHKKGSTAFDATESEQHITGFQKRLKIEHKKSDNSSAIAVTGKFSYSRKSVLDVHTGRFSGAKKIFSQRKNQLSELQAQVSDFVTIAMTEYQKGTAANPIYLQPSQGNQAELSLAILMEFKKRAILEGKELIASDDSGKRITITPNYDFKGVEKAYFESFAMQMPKVKSGKGQEVISATQPAAYHLFKDVKLDNGKPLKEQAISSAFVTQVTEAMTNHLKESVAKQVAEQEKSMAKALAALPASIKEPANRAMRL